MSIRLDGVVFLAAETARSQAYAQAFRARGLCVPQTVVISRPGVVSAAVAPSAPADWNGPLLPDLAEPLAVTCESFSDDVIRVEAETLKDQAIEEVLRGYAMGGASLVAYSGFGGQLVPESLLKLGLGFLHCHSGWLPDYRGSTTVYYSLLEGSLCGVSAILLTKGIDEGPIIARRHYPAPPATLDIDYLYDPAIRADLMADTLMGWARAGGFEESFTQRPEEGRTFYVIHPVLKHLALLSLGRSPEHRR